MGWPGQWGAELGLWVANFPLAPRPPLRDHGANFSQSGFLLSQSVDCLSPSFLSFCSHTHFFGGSELTSLLTLLWNSQPQNPFIILAQLKGLWSALALPDFLRLMPSFSGFCDTQGSWLPSEPVFLPVSGSLASSSSQPNLL